MDEIRVVDVEVHEDTAIALGLGSGTLNGVGHPFVEVD